MIDEANPDQLDTNRDGFGDACDNDIDKDGVMNYRDNCVYVSNYNQIYSSRNYIGIACENDYDGDTVVDILDPCPNNSLIQYVDFTDLQEISLDPKSNRVYPRWIANGPKEVHQEANSGAGLAVGRAKFYGVDFRGTFYVNTQEDDDFIGFIF
ncbi:hypothetical protein NQ317_011817, partial [Molorchus minor]